MTSPTLPNCRLVLRLLALGLALLTTSAHAVINAGLQPYDLYHTRYTSVAILDLQRVDTVAGTVDARIARALKGTLPQGAAIRLQFSDAMKSAAAEAAQQGDLKAGDQAVVFAGRRRRAQDLMLYANGFFLGEMTTSNRWTLDQSGQAMTGIDGQEISTLAGTWNGSTDQLVALVEDIAAGRDFFPRKGYVRFQADRLLDQFDAPVTGVAVYDLEGDGDLDVVACSRQGDRVYLQTEPMQFVNATAALGLDSASGSCAVADFNADGLTDLLAGAILYRGCFTNNRFRFEKTELLPASLGDNLKTAAFVELNGDGYPDIVASIAGGGLRAFLNPGQAGGAFQDRTHALGLDRPECGAGQTGFCTPGDWNGDRRADLFYAAGAGFLLVPDAQGVFQPVPHDIEFKFTTGLNDEPGRTGAGVFAPLLSPGRMDLVVPIEDGWLVVANQQGRPADITRWGNEISEGSQAHLATLAEDLNLDGHVDFYTVSHAPNGHNRYIINRGYGSFMLAAVHKHFEHVFNGPANELGGLSVAAGDLNDDGAPDLVLGNGHGQLTLILNDTLATRAPAEHPTPEIAALEKVKLLTVQVLGPKGVVNARVLLADAAGQLVARRDLGQNVSGGSAGPAQTTLAVRQPGQYQLRVQYADGLERSQNVDLTQKLRLTVTVDRGDQSDDDVF